MKYRQSVFRRWVSCVTMMAFFVFNAMSPASVFALTCSDLGPSDGGFNCTDGENGVAVTTLREVNLNLGSFDSAAESLNVFDLSLGNFTANVIGNNPTLIGGKFEIKNGVMSIFNANGVHVLSTADFKFENGSLLAAAGNMNKVTGKIDATGFVLNEGIFHGTGDVALVGKAVENRGTIDLPASRVFLGGGKVVTVGLSGDNLISVVVEDEVGSGEGLLDFEGNPIKNQIKNSKDITAHKITLDAKGVDSVFEKAINLTGEIKAVDVRINKEGVPEFVSQGEIDFAAQSDIYNAANLKAAKIKMNTDGKISNAGTIDAQEFKEHGYTFKNTGTLQGGRVLMDNTDGAADISGVLNVDSVEDTGDINLVGNVTLGRHVTMIADSDANGTGKITFSDDISLSGSDDHYNLTLRASGQSIIRSMDDLGDLILSAQTAGAQFTLRNAIVMNGDLEVGANAILDGGFSVTVGGGDVTGAGTINLSGGTFKVIGNGSFGGSQDWTFGTLQFGDGNTDGVTVKVGANKVTALDELVISLKHTLSAGSSTWNLSWGGGFLTDVIKIVSGDNHSLALLSNGIVKAWGGNSSGQLGDGTTTSSYTPTSVIGLTDVVDIAAGRAHSLARLNDGTVKAWGYNVSGQLGDGTTTDRLTPISVSGLGGVVEISAGALHSLARLVDGTVKAWGNNGNGQLGDGTQTQRLTPISVIGLSGVAEIDAGDSHSLARLNDGTVKAWGNNSGGQLGDGTQTQRLTPVSVSGLDAVVEISAGASHSLARLNDGTVKGWGDNSYGQLGDGTTTGRLTPVSAVGLTGAVELAAGLYYSMARLNDGTVKAWGYNGGGQLGDGSTTTRLTPVNVNGISLVDNITAGGGTSLVRLRDGTVKSWGSNGAGQLGDGTITNRLSPVFVRAAFENLVSLSDISKIVSAGGHSLALKSDGTRVYAWGKNDYGQLGDGTNDIALTPVAVRSDDGLSYLTGVQEIEAGEFHSLAIMSNGNVKAWGRNTYGQLGDGTTVDRLTPVGVIGLSSVIGISAGHFHSLAVLANSTVMAWGFNGSGQLGDGTTTNRLAPVSVNGLTGVLEVEAGTSHSLARLSDLTVKAWGDNTYGQLGDGTSNRRLTPVSVISLAGAVEIAAGAYHSLARLSDGTVKAWGYNLYGQLGNGATQSRSTPVLVSGLAGVTQIAAGTSHSLAKLNDGTVKAWGRNNAGQLGDGTTTNRLTPVSVAGLIGVDQIGAGSDNSISNLSNGQVMSWGGNSTGQLGNNSITSSSSPVYVTILSRAPFVADGTFNAEESTFQYTGDYAFGRRVGVTTAADEPYRYVEPPNIDPSIRGVNPIQPRIKPFPVSPRPVEINPKDVFPGSLDPLRDIQSSLGGRGGSNPHDWLNQFFGTGEMRNQALKTGLNTFEVSPADLGVDEGSEQFQKAIFEADAQPEEGRKVLDSEKRTDTVVANVTGNVRVVSGDGRIYEAKEGMALAKGDQIWTDKTAKVELSNKGDIVTVSEGSAVQVQNQNEEGKPVQDLLTLAFGKVSVAVSDDSSSSFVIQTPNGISGTRA